jgi:predicted esterase
MPPPLPSLTAGPAPAQADAVLLLLHGRGSTAQDILSLYVALDLPTVAAVAPQAPGNTWYPHSFLAPLESNQPFLDSALRRIESLITDLLFQKILSQKIILLGFSQGACLATEFAARHPRRYGAIIAFTGGLIGPPGTPRAYPGSLAGVAVFLGSADPDPHVPFERVEETAGLLTQMGAEVDLRRYPGMAHTISDDELQAAREIIQRTIANEH